VPGLGPARSAALLKQFGSLKRLKAASVEEIMSVPGMGERTAAAVVAALGGGGTGGPGAAAEDGAAPSGGAAADGPHGVVASASPTGAA
jgi:excinuclease ABC subunit C